MGTIAIALLAVWINFAELGAPRPPTEFQAHDAHQWMAHAWELESGRLAGRDYITTYGIASQVFSWAAVSLHASNDYLSSPPRILFIFRLVATFLLATLALLWTRCSDTDPRLAMLAFLLFGLPWSFSSMRLAAGAVAVATSALLLSRSPHAPATLLSALGCALVATITPDFAVYALAGSICAALALRNLSLRHRLCVTAGLVASFALFIGLFDLLLAWSSNDGRTAAGTYLAETTQLIRTYSLTVGKSWRLEPVRTISIACVAALVAGWSLMRARTASAPERALILGTLGFSCVVIQGALVRSGLDHIELGFAGSPLLLALIQPRRESTGLAASRLYWIFLTVLASAAIPHDRADLIRSIASPFASGREAWATLRHGTDPTDPIFPRLDERHSDRTRPLYVIPYENSVAIRLRRPLAQRIDQNYKAHDLALQAIQVNSILSAPRNLEVALRLGSAMDAVPDIARTPEVYRMLLREFALDPTAPRDGPWRLLQRREAPRPEVWTTLSLSNLEPGSTRGSVAFPDPVRCDLAELSLRLEYGGLAAGLRKRQRLRVSIESVDAPLREAILVPLDRTGSFRTILEVEPGASFERSLGAAPAELKPGLTRLRWRPERTDAIAAKLSHVRLEGLRCW